MILAAALPAFAGAEEAGAPPDPAPAASPSSPKDIDSLKEAPFTVLHDTAAILKSPASWDASDWRTLAFGTLAVAGTALALDKPVKDAFERNHSKALQDMTDRIGNLSLAGSVAVAGGFYLTGMFTGNAEARATGTDAISASLITGALIVPALKYSIGRYRPDKDRSTFSAKPFGNGDPGFPSAHATELFTMAAVITAHYPDTWVQVAAYGFAGLTGLSRIAGNHHYTSDVVAGSLIGYAVGKAVVAMNQKVRFGKTGEFTLSPDVRPDGYKGLQARLVF